MIFLFILTVFAQKDNEIQNIQFQITNSLYKVDQGEVLHMHYNAFNSAFSFKLMKFDKSTSNFDIQQVYHFDQWPDVIKETDGCHPILNNPKIRLTQNLSYTYLHNITNAQAIITMNKYFFFLSTFQNEEQLLRFFENTHYDLSVQPRGPILHFNQDIPLPKDPNNTIKFGFVNEGNLFLMQNDNIWIKTMNESRIFEVFGDFNKQGIINKIKFGIDMLAVQRKEYPRTIECYQINQTFVKLINTIDTQLQEIQDFVVVENTLVICDFSLGILIYFIPTGDLIKTIKIEGCKKLYVEKNTLLGVFTSKTKSDYIIEFFMAFSKFEYQVNSIYNEDTQIRDIFTFSNYGIIIEQSQLVIVRLQLQKTLSKSEEMRIIEVFDIPNVLGVSIIDEVITEKGIIYKMIYYTSKEIQFVDFIIHSPQISCTLKNVGLFQYQFYMNTSQCLSNENQNSYKSLFQYCLVTHDFEIQVQSVYMVFQYKWALYLIVGLIGLGVILFLFGLFCMNARWTKSLQYLKQKCQNIKIKYEVMENVQKQTGENIIVTSERIDTNQGDGQRGQF